MDNFPGEISSNEYRKMLEDGTITSNKGWLSFNFDKIIKQPSPDNNVLFNSKPPKYRNKKCVYNDIPFDSELERDYYIFLVKCGINFTMKPKIILQPAFKWNGKSVQEIAWNPDYCIPDANLYIDTKSYSNDTFPIKLKMFKYLYQNQSNNGMGWEVFVVKFRSHFELSRYCINKRLQGTPDYEQEKLLLFKKSTKFTK